MSKRHDIKVWPEYFRQITSGNKTFEIRKNDRNYQPGDTVLLREWCPKRKEYTGASDRRQIGYMLDSEFGLEPGYVAFSLLFD